MVAQKTMLRLTHQFQDTLSLYTTRAFLKLLFTLLLFVLKRVLVLSVNATNLLLYMKETLGNHVI